MAFSVDGTLVNWSNNSTVSLPNGEAYTFILTANGGPNGTSTWSALFGTHTVNAWVDDANQIAELNENNNQFSTSISVGAPPGGDLPDLIVTDLAWSPSNPSVGTAIQFTGTVKNQGAAATPSGTLVTVAYLVDGTLVNWTHNLAPVVYPGAISIEPADGGPNGINTWTVTSGTHTVEARVDENNIIAESNESNNSLTATLALGGGETQPPAAPTGLTATAGNSQVSLSWNVSSGAASYKVKRSTASGGPYTLVSSPTTTSFTDTGLSNGTTYYYVISAVNAGSESANSGQVSATPTAPSNLPDLIVTDLTWSPGSPSTGNAIQFTATVKNQGTVATPNGVFVHVAYLVDGVLVNWTHNLAPVIYPGAISIQPADGGVGGSNTWTATSGGHSIEAWVDDDNLIAEINENNNTLTTALSVGGGTPPPSAPTGLTATAGDAQISLSWNASSGATNYKVKRSATSGGSYVVVSSPTATSFIDTGLANGTTYYYVISAVNAGGESGNSSQVSAIPTAPPGSGNLPDLIITSVKWLPEYSGLAAGIPLNFEATVKNQGTASTPANTIVRVAFLVDGVLVNWSDNLAPLIAPGGISIQAANDGINGASTWAAVDGAHTLTAWVDDLGQIAESNENNNTFSVSMVTGVDTDKDGIPDWQETATYGTDPNNPDTDGDGMTDGYEIANGLNPLVDDAGNANGQGITNLAAFQNSPSGDPDGDGFTNAQEALMGTDPHVYDLSAKSVTYDAFPLAISSAPSPTAFYTQQISLPPEAAQWESQGLPVKKFIVFEEEATGPLAGWVVSTVAMLNGQPFVRYHGSPLTFNVTDKWNNALGGGNTLSAFDEIGCFKFLAPFHVMATVVPNVKFSSLNLVPTTQPSYYHTIDGTGVLEGNPPPGMRFVGVAKNGTAENPYPHAGELQFAQSVQTIRIINFIDGSRLERKSNKQLVDSNPYPTLSSINDPPPEMEILTSDTPRLNIPAEAESDITSINILDTFNLYMQFKFSNGFHSSFRERVLGIWCDG